MVDWKRVESLRRKGRSWDRVAADPKVQFSPQDIEEDPGRTLKAMYYSRKSQTHAPPTRPPAVEVHNGPKERPPLTVRRLLVPSGLTVAVAGVVWFALAFASPLVGIVLPALPDVALVAAGGGVVLLVGLALRTAQLSRSWKKPMAIGLVLGLVIAGLCAVIGGDLGLPQLNPAFSEAAGQGWEGAHNAVWKDGGGLPVFLIIGSVACPYCAASSWAFSEALHAFGSLQGAHASESETGYVYSNTPEIALDASSLTSGSVSWDPREASDNQNIHLPSLSPTEQAYYSYYHPSSGIPFLVVVGGIFVHTTQLVDPGCLFSGGCGCDYASGACGSALGYPTVQADVASGTGSVYNAIHHGAIYLEACLVKSDQIAGVTPPSLPSDVMAIVPNLSN